MKNRPLVRVALLFRYKKGNHQPSKRHSSECRLKSALVSLEYARRIRRLCFTIPGRTSLDLAPGQLSGSRRRGKRMIIAPVRARASSSETLESGILSL